MATIKQVKKFKGTPGQYRALHNWVERQLGKPQECENCGATDKRMTWANLSDNYLRDISDWARLCYSCHAYYDNRHNGPRKVKPACGKGHLYTPENTNIKTSKGVPFRQCRACIKLLNDKANAIRKASKEGTEK